ncbi:uncharacterized protein AB675_1476 [Cyphellophora attinorum]|uniref:Uncharacterized protein n=1 Tax=Cyphellophora attinorum TaxID=1664694 RepID=A0A0N1HPM7_9EURO|nr:uncharacterized protein AB675_1476 [Phialophora attinorum]KPI37232.1 hypothetical protein AB675_1476 [Phialophora attinorum]
MDLPEETPTTVAMTDAPADAVTDTAASKKSYRRKYRKMMVTFEQRMRESTALYRDEQKMLQISQRLAEQNDQIMQLLVDINNMPQVPPTLRYNLDGKDGPIEPREEPSQTYDQQSGHRALRKARYDLQLGHITQHDYEVLKREILQSPDFAPKKSYMSLLEDCSAHLTAPPDGVSDSPEFRSGYLTVSQQDNMERALDAFVRGEAPTTRSHVNGIVKDGERNIDKEKEMQFRNPVSAYNYLRKHEPKVFLQDEETKPSRTTGARASKRSSTRDSIIKQEQDLYDEDGIAIDTPNSRPKRKRDEDGGYRPKGGAARKRKRDSEANASRSRKKPSIG